MSLDFRTSRFTYRQKDCFGIAGLVTDLDDVYYTAFFDTHHLGRVGDLLCHFLRVGGMAEYRLRQALNQATFQGYFDPENVGESFRDPLVMECSKDYEKIVIGFSMLVHGISLVAVGELKARLDSRQPTNAFEQMLLSINDHVDELIIKLHPTTHRVELDLVFIHETPSSFSFFKSNAQAPVLNLVSISPPWIIVIDRIQNLNPPEPRSYVELGDLKYPKFLEREVYDMSVASQSAREFPVRKAPVKRTLFEKIFRLDPSVDQLVENLKDPMDPLIPNLSSFSDLKTNSPELTFDGMVLEQHRPKSDSYAEDRAQGLLRDVLAKRIEINEFSELLLRSFKVKEAALQNQINILKNEVHEKTGRLRRLDSVVDELKTQVRELALDRTDLQARLKNLPKTPAVTEKYERLKYKFERLLEQAEEFKKLNRRLVERFDLLNNPNIAPDANPAEAKRRLEAAMMQLSKGRADNILLKARIELLEKNDQLQKAELSELQKKISTKV